MFIDFEVGKSYKKKLKLINISYSFNTFVLGEFPDEFKKYFQVIYQPAGRVSAGIDVPIKVLFFPQ